MNNKFIKRVAAVVLSVAVLSTCAFAATIESAEYTGNRWVTFSYETKAGASVSYIAYAVSGGNEGEIVAVGQVDDSDESGTVNITMNNSKLKYCEAINIYVGDDTGDTKVKKGLQEYTYLTDIKVGTAEAPIDVNGDKVYDVVKTAMTVTANQAGEYALNSLKVKVGDEEKEFSLGTTEGETTVYPSYEATEGAEITVDNIYLAGLNDEQLAKTITIVPNIVYSVISAE